MICDLEMWQITRRKTDASAPANSQTALSECDNPLPANMMNPSSETCQIAVPKTDESSSANMTPQTKKANPEIREFAP
jgi:hypothetical protein